MEKGLGNGCNCSPNSLSFCFSVDTSVEARLSETENDAKVNFYISTSTDNDIVGLGVLA